MNRKDILEIGAGREIDRLVAEKIMGWRFGIDFDQMDSYDPILRYVPFTNDVKEYRFSSNMSDAWEVMEQFAKSEIVINKTEEGVRASIWLNWNMGWTVHEETLPLAICKVALLTTL